MPSGFHTSSVDARMGAVSLRRIADYDAAIPYYEILISSSGFVTATTIKIYKVNLLGTFTWST